VGIDKVENHRLMILGYVGIGGRGTRPCCNIRNLGRRRDSRNPSRCIAALILSPGRRRGARYRYLPFGLMLP
jgi:hypothetical protein